MAAPLSEAVSVSVPEAAVVASVSVPEAAVVPSVSEVIASAFDVASVSTPEEAAVVSASVVASVEASAEASADVSVAEIAAVSEVSSVTATELAVDAAVVSATDSAEVSEIVAASSVLEASAISSTLSVVASTSADVCSVVSEAELSIGVVVDSSVSETTGSASDVGITRDSTASEEGTGSVVEMLESEVDEVEITGTSEDVDDVSSLDRVGISDELGLKVSVEELEVITGRTIEVELELDVELVRSSSEGLKVDKLDEELSKSLSVGVAVEIVGEEEVLLVKGLKLVVVSEGEVEISCELGVTVSEVLADVDEVDAVESEAITASMVVVSIPSSEVSSEGSALKLEVTPEVVVSSSSVDEAGAAELGVLSEATGAEVVGVEVVVPVPLVLVVLVLDVEAVFLSALELAEPSASVELESDVVVGLTVELDDVVVSVLVPLVVGVVSVAGLEVVVVVESLVVPAPEVVVVPLVLEVVAGFDARFKTSGLAEATGLEVAWFESAWSVGLSKDCAGLFRDAAAAGAVDSVVVAGVLLVVCPREKSSNVGSESSAEIEVVDAVVGRVCVGDAVD